MRQRWFIIIGLMVIAIIAGVGVAFSLDIGSTPSTMPSRSFTIQEILLGTPAVAGDWQPAARLTQKRNYATGERLAVRIISSEPPERSVTLTARLLSASGSIVPLTPGQITVSGGTSGFCCWTVAEAGTYQLQLFRPDDSISSLPLVIVEQRSSTGGVTF